MITYDEDFVEGIYIKKFYGRFCNILMYLLGILISVIVTIVYIMAFEFLIFFISFGSLRMTGENLNVPMETFVYVSLGLFVAMWIIWLVIAHYVCKINCWMALDKKKLYVIGYLRGQKFEKIVNIKDIKQIEWTGGYSYKGKNYTEVTLYLTENEKIKNIPVEYKSELYYFLMDLNK